MKETILVVVLVGASVALNNLNGPTENEKAEAQRQRKVLKEKEEMTRDLLVMRDNINQQLKNAEGTTGQDLSILRRNVEMEHRKLHQSMLEITAGKSPDAWSTIRRRTLETIKVVRHEYLRFQGGVDNVVISMEKIE